MKILMLGSSEVKLNEYRYDLCRSLLFGEDIEVETTREGAVRSFVGRQRPDLVILDGSGRSTAVNHFVDWLNTLPNKDLFNLRVILLKKGSYVCETELVVHTLRCPKVILHHPLNAREVKQASFNYCYN